MGATPLWFTRILSELSLYTTSFSKYGNIYKREHDAFDVDVLTVHTEENWNDSRRQLIC